MPKKKNQQTNVAATKEPAPVEDAKVDDTTPLESAASDTESAAVETSVINPSEEYKVDSDLMNKQASAANAEEAEEAYEDDVDSQPKASQLQRQGSRFNLTKDGEGEEITDDSNPLYRPEFGTPVEGQNKMWELMSSYIGGDQRSIQRSIVNHVEYTLARTRFDFDDKGAYQATAYSVRDRLIEAWNDTQ